MWEFVDHIADSVVNLDVNLDAVQKVRALGDAYGVSDAMQQLAHASGVWERKDSGEWILRGVEESSKVVDLEKDNTNRKLMLKAVRRLARFRTGENIESSCSPDALRFVKFSTGKESSGERLRKVQCLSPVHKTLERLLKQSSEFTPSTQLKEEPNIKNDLNRAEEENAPSPLSLEVDRTPALQKKEQSAFNTPGYTPFVKTKEQKNLDLLLEKTSDFTPFAQTREHQSLERLLEETAEFTPSQRNLDRLLQKSSTCTPLGERGVDLSNKMVSPTSTPSGIIGRASWSGIEHISTSGNEDLLKALKEVRDLRAAMENIVCAASKWQNQQENKISKERKVIEGALLVAQENEAAARTKILQLEERISELETECVAASKESNAATQSLVVAEKDAAAARTKILQLEERISELETECVAASKESNAATQSLVVAEKDAAAARTKILQLEERISELETECVAASKESNATTTTSLEKELAEEKEKNEALQSELEKLRYAANDAHTSQVALVAEHAVVNQLQESLRTTERRLAHYTSREYLNKRVRVRFDGGSFYEGIVDAFDPDAGKTSESFKPFHITYDDGDDEWTHLPDASIELLDAHKSNSVEGEMEAALATASAEILRLQEELALVKASKITQENVVNVGKENDSSFHLPGAISLLSLKASDKNHQENGTATGFGFATSPISKLDKAQRNLPSFPDFENSELRMHGGRAVTPQKSTIIAKEKKNISSPVVGAQYEIKFPPSMDSAERNQAQELAKKSQTGTALALSLALAIEADTEDGDDNVAKKIPQDSILDESSRIEAAKRALRDAEAKGDAEAAAIARASLAKAEVVDSQVIVSPTDFTDNQVEYILQKEMVDRLESTILQKELELSVEKAGRTAKAIGLGVVHAFTSWLSSE
eukprot:g2199.t1